MPDHGQGRVHRFRDYVDLGVNWRPTRFVHEVPSSRVCGLCRMIPKWTVLLPCGHALCKSCHAATFEGAVGRCPLDEVQFEEAECVHYKFPTRIANTLKVYCWNEQHGCEYTGTMDRMLEHYEDECTFHTVECLRCGEGVQHRDLPTHYAAGCRIGVSSAITESSEHTALTRAYVNAALKDVKAMLGCLNHDQLLPVIQSQLNELKEQVRGQETRFADITRDIGVCRRKLKDDMAQTAANISSTVSHQLMSRRNREEEASTSSWLSLRSEMALILRKLERLADLQPSRQNLREPDSSRVIAHCSLSCGVGQHLINALSTTPAWIQKIGNVTYDLTLENCEEIIQYQGPRKKFAEITVWHTRDTYFTVAVFKRCDYLSALTVEIEFNGMLENSSCWPPFWGVSVCGNGTEKQSSVTSSAMPCCCKRHDHSLLHFHLEFCMGTAWLNNDSFVGEGKITFEIELIDVELHDTVKGAPYRLS